VVILALKPGHDGAAAVIADRRMVVSLESEKDSFIRNSTLTPTTLLAVAEATGQLPDVIALSGWMKYPWLGLNKIGDGYTGDQVGTVREASLFGRRAKVFSSTHERSHIAMAIGMAPREDASSRVVLVWEGITGSFFVLDRDWAVTRRVDVLRRPGHRYGFLYGLADPTFGDAVQLPRLEDSGKLMALAAYAKASDCDPGVAATVDRILDPSTNLRSAKQAFRDSPVYNAGVEADVTKAAAAYMTERMFEEFAKAAREQLPSGVPLYISGGCGLNCEWNVKWRDCGQFSSVFVPPCTSDSGSALGTAIDALLSETGDPVIDWNVYGGLEFVSDTEPDAGRWRRRPLDPAAVADALADGEVFAWVQGRWEIGPRALGNRSLLTEPFNPATRDRLNAIKQREGFRPIAPVCRLEDAGAAFSADFPDPYMLYFRNVRDERLGAITHVDGSARVQTVTREENAPLHELLSAFAARSGLGVLCNTSLNFKGLGFVNRMSDLVNYCDSRDIRQMVVGDTWYTAAGGEDASS
jgi:hydroxymethyl cephem carbamoyltransferase